MNDKIFKFLITGIIVLLAVFFDQWTKNWAEENLADPRFSNHSVSVQVEENGTLESFIQNRYANNTEIENKRIMANAYRDDQRLMPQNPVEAGQTVVLNQVTLNVVDGYYDYRYAQNTGAAFSFLADQSPTFRKYFFGITGIIAIILILVFIGVSSWRKQKTIIIALACVLGGAIGNILDRSRLGYVIDFISWHYQDQYYWPTFNIADVFVTCGVIFLIVDLLIHRTSLNDSPKAVSDDSSKETSSPESDDKASEA